MGAFARARIGYPSNSKWPPSVSQGEKGACYNLEGLSGALFLIRWVFWVVKNEKRLRDLGADFRSVHRQDEESV